MDLNTLVSAVFIIAGWVVVHSLTEYREHRKEIRGKLDTYINELSILETNAIAFHQAAHFSSSDLRKLLWQISRLSHRIGLFKAYELKVDPKCFMRLRQSITIRNCEPSQFLPQGEDSEILKEIGAAFDEMQDELENAYAQRYAVNPPIRLVQLLQRKI